MQRTLSLLCLCALLLAGCNIPAKPDLPAEPVLQKYQYQFFGVFDTLVQITAYCETEEEFRAHAEAAEAEFIRLHKLFDRFNSYEGLNNIHTINMSAGGEPVAVAPEIIDCVAMSVDWYHRSGGKVNVAMGSLTGVWQSYISRYNTDTPPDATTLPDRAELEAAAQHMDIASVVIDRAGGTIALTDPEAALDLGSTAKGYATELVARLMESRGLYSYIISAGGNVRCGARPEDGQRAGWGIALENPDPTLIPTESGFLDVLFASHISVVSSGDYQRYYFYGDRRIHHLIDPATLEPGTRYRMVTVVAPDSGDCDALSTAVFMSDMEEGRALAQSIGAEVIWVTPDGEITVTEGLIPHLRDRGGALNTRS